ncbi:MAG: hypothetical protein DRH43_01695 [Deltaproteobacteria bacterium]|nr:MAG: hypothetical protein DRH43_01695 [Deltaproteobacteria bacterium]
MNKPQPTAPKTAQYIETQKQILSNMPACGTTHYNLAIGLIKEQKWDEAIEELAAAIEHSPTLDEAYADLGGIYLHKGNLAACIAANQQAIKMRPKFAPGYANLGFAYLQKGDVEAALPFLQRAISLNPHMVQAYATLASAYFMRGQLDDCIAAAKKALELAPTFAVAHNNLALAYFEKKAYKKAVEHCDKALAYGFDVKPEFLKQLEPYR